MKKSVVIFIFFIAFLMDSFAINCNDINQLAGYGIIGEDGFDYGNNSQINNQNISGSGNTPTPTGSVTTVNPSFPPLSPATFPSFSSSTDKKNVSTISAGTYNKIEIASNNFTTAFTGGTYYIKELILSKSNTTAQLAPGDYYIEKISMANNSFITISPAGPVRIFIKDSIQGGNEIGINANGAVENLIIYLYSDASIDIGNGEQGHSNLNFNGVIYSPYDNTSIEFGNNNDIQGAILSAGEIDVGNNTYFNYSSAVESAVIGAFGCTRIPIADYRLDECKWNGTTGEVKDSSGNNLHGTAQGTAQISTDSIINLSGVFDNSTSNNAAISIPDNNLLSPHVGTNGEITVSAWVKLNAYPTSALQGRIPIVAKGDNNNWEYALYIYQDHRAGFSVWQSSGSSYKEISGGNLALNTWYHITGVLKKGSFARVYVNGNLIVESTSGFSGTTTNGTSPLYIARRGSGNNYLNGYIDEAKIFAKAFTQTEVQSVYSNEQADKNYDGTSRTASCCCLPSGGNLIANPSFETLCQSTIIQTWNNVSGGTVNMRNNVCGWTMNGTGMETWENTTLKPASNGTVFVEIDGYSTTVDRLSQNLNTANGVHYVISFDYRARNGGSDRIIAKWNGTEVGTFNGITTGWQTAQIEVVGTGSDILAFEEPSADNNSYGSWIDNIRVAEGTLATNCTSFTYEPYHSYNASLTPSYRLHTRISQQPFDLNVTVACAGSGTIPARKIKNIYAIDGAATSCNAATPKLFTLLSNGTYDINDTNKIITIPNLNITKAYSNIKLMLETNSSEFNCSNDAMAMRPTGYTFSSPSIKAGETVNVAAINGGTGYNGTANVTTALSAPNANCTTQTKFLSDSEPKLLTFNADANNSTLIGKDVSDINVTITDKIWTTIDNPNDCIINSNTTSYSGLSGKIGCDINSTLPLTITPYELNTTLQSFTVPGTGLQPWLYLDSNRTQHVEINTTIEAFGKDGTKTQNFSDACAGSDVPLGYYFTTTGSSPSNVNVSLTASTGSVNTVKEDNSESYTNVFNLQNFFTVTKSSFKNGDANLSLKFNFIRPATPINPFKLKLTNINITNPNVIDNNATGLDKNATFVYGRARSYDIATNTSPIDVPIEFEVYSTTSGGFVSGMPQNVLKWYRNLDHDTAATGTVINGSYTAGGANMTTISSPQDGIQTVTVTSTQDQTIHLDISPWLWYSLNPLKTYNYGTDCTQHPCFHYDFTDTTTGVQGVNSGTFQGSDFQMTPAKNITNKGVKLFR